MTRSIRYMYLLCYRSSLSLFFLLLLSYLHTKAGHCRHWWWGNTHAHTHTQLSSYANYTPNFFLCRLYWMKKQKLKKYILYMARLLSLLIVYFFCQPSHHKTWQWTHKWVTAELSNRAWSMYCEQMMSHSFWLSRSKGMLLERSSWMSFALAHTVHG